MDSRLKFLHHLRLIDDAVTQKDSMSRLMVEPVQAVRLNCSEVRNSEGRAVTGSEIK